MPDRPPTTKASRPPRPAAPPGGGRKEIFGMPPWMLAVGAVVLVGGYLWIRSRSQQTQGQGQGKGQPGFVIGGSQTGLSYEQLLLILKDWQQGHHKHGGGGGGGDHHHKHHHHPPKGGGGEGPEREWLERVTGSQHPWAYLAQHHERVVVGPSGSRIIKGSGDGSGSKGPSQ